MRTWVEKVHPKSWKMCTRCQLLTSLHFVAHTSILFVLHVLHVADWSIGFSLLAPVWTKSNEVQPAIPTEILCRWLRSNVLRCLVGLPALWTQQTEPCPTGSWQVLRQSSFSFEKRKFCSKADTPRNRKKNSESSEWAEWWSEWLQILKILDFTCFILLNFRLRHIRPRSMECTLFALARGKRFNRFRLYSLHFNLNSYLVLCKHVRKWVQCVCLCVFFVMVWGKWCRRLC